MYQVMDMVRNLSEEIKNLQDKQPFKARELVTEKNLPQFPLTTMENLEALESLLIEKKEACVELVIKFYMYRILYITNSVLHKNKNSLKKMLLYNCFCRLKFFKSFYNIKFCSHQQLSL